MSIYYASRFVKIALIAGWVKIDFFWPERASTKLNYCLRKVWPKYEGIATLRVMAVRNVGMLRAHF